MDPRHQGRDPHRRRPDGDRFEVHRHHGLRPAGSPRHDAGPRCAWDDDAGTGDCEVEKLGPVLTGRAGFTIEPTSETASEVVWIEDVKVRYLPRVLAPIAKVAGAAGFRLGMRKLGKQLATR